MNNSKPSQARKILNYLMEHETITGNEAEEYFACKRLTSRISELKKAGHFIICERINGKNRFGEKCHWGQYRLIKDMEGANLCQAQIRKESKKVLNAKKEVAKYILQKWYNENKAKGDEQDLVLELAAENGVELEEGV